MSVYSGWAREPEGMRRALLGPEPETMRRWLAFLRISVGGMYLYAFSSNLTHNFVAGFPARLSQLADAAMLPLAGRLLGGFVFNHSTVVAWVVLAVQVIAGALLLLGLGTRVVAALAIFLHALYLLVSLGSGVATTASNGLFIGALLVIFGTDGGWRWSLDEMIVNRK